jgi:hypothetical protein
MNYKKFRGIYVGWIMLVTAAALVAKKLRLFAISDTSSYWWALFLLIPVGDFVIRAIVYWRQNERRRSRNMIRLALLILPILAALLYPPLWKVIYIPFIVVVGVDMILGNIIGSSKPK